MGKILQILPAPHDLSFISAAQDGSGEICYPVLVLALVETEPEHQNVAPVIVKEGLPIVVGGKDTVAGYLEYA